MCDLVIEMSCVPTHTRHVYTCKQSCIVYSRKMREYIMYSGKGRGKQLKRINKEKVLVSFVCFFQFFLLINNEKKI